ncbi:Gfo/Idh/MocA family protein [Spirochaeta isovalerica]|uniref:Putative dehydrogenase n=1 Tax=Spirochaeta isovalerica TaxID=150 RepID=A0A841REZ2_9SPIO|nr:Gfo/Idh/MocA family oxidoreductase [Spirochaeta isovalerica]MBB6480922.1 putative dehydrogenase [Spirochaeta isovalerica]
MNKIKLAIIGCGIITKEAHLPALKRLTDRMEVAAVCNRTASKAEDIAEELGLDHSAVWTDWKKMISELKDLDAVLIALPITMNYEVSRACCQAGLAVLCEKPAAMTAREAEETATFSTQFGVTYMTAENFHYDRGFLKAAELVKAGKIGNVHSMSWNVLSWMEVDNKYNKTEWRAHNEYPGGYVLDGGVHFVHALQMIGGPVESVFAHTASVDGRLGTMDTAMSLIRHKSGCVSSLNMGWRSASDDGALRIFGDKGSLIMGRGNVKELKPDGTEELHTFEEESSFYLQWSAFLDALEGKKEGLIPERMPADDVKTVLAMIESEKNGMAVTINS